jgi:uncharacterized protein YbbK (DUF523 family)
MADKLLVSTCLLGSPVRFDGRDMGFNCPLLERLATEGRLVPICPELAGGLPVPRAPAEIQADGRVVDVTGADVTMAFAEGAERALALAQAEGCRFALLTDGSPSCGSAFVHDGSFSGRRVAGVGVTAALLERHGIRVFSPDRIGELATLVG